MKNLLTRAGHRLLFGLRISTILLTLIGIICCLPVKSEDMDGNKTTLAIKPSDRIKNEQESVWDEFAKLANKYKPLNLGQGFPDFSAPHFIVNSLHNATDPNDPSKWSVHQYPRSFGHPRLVKAMRDYYLEFRSFKQLQDPNTQVLITVGAHEAIYASIMAFVNRDDEVLIIDPAYDAYAASIRLAQGKPISVPLRPYREVNDNQTSSLSSAVYKLDMNEFESKITNKTRVLVLNTPNNPLGKIFTLSELEAISKLCIKYNLLVVADEVYEHIYYSTSEPHISIASLPGMWSRTMTIGSAGKTFSVTGWKIGWIFGPPELIKYVQFVHQSSILQVATPLQEATARAFEHEMDLLRANKTGYWQLELRSDLIVKRNRMVEMLTKAQMSPIVPQGGYFMVADFSKLAKLFPEYKQEGFARGGVNTNDFKFARWLSSSKKLQGIPVSAFYSKENKNLGENLMRFCFIKSDETLNKLESLINSFSSQLMKSGSSSNETPKSKL